MKSINEIKYSTANMESITTTQHITKLEKIIKNGLVDGDNYITYSIQDNITSEYLVKQLRESGYSAKLSKMTNTIYVALNEKYKFNISLIVVPVLITLLLVAVVNNALEHNSFNLITTGITYIVLASIYNIYQYAIYTSAKKCNKK